MSSHAAQKSHGHGHRRSVALFGGTFDPIHAGHIAVAEAAQKRFHLDTIHFVPSARPPHKTKPALTPFVHRYAMVALACSDHADFRPSLAEAPAEGAPPHAFYTIDTVRRYRREHPDDHLFFIVGADQFLEIPTWKNYEALLDSCDFIIASRPGFRLDALRLVLPPEKLGRSASRDPSSSCGAPPTSTRSSVASFPISAPARSRPKCAPTPNWAPAGPISSSPR